MKLFFFFLLFHPSTFRLHPFVVPLADQGGFTGAGRGRNQGQPVFQNFIEFFKQIGTGDQTPRLRLGYINFGAQDGRFHTAKYTIAELTLLIGTMQFRPSSSA